MGRPQRSQPMPLSLPNMPSPISRTWVQPLLWSIGLACFERTLAAQIRAVGCDLSSFCQRGYAFEKRVHDLVKADRGALRSDEIPVFRYS